MWCDECKKEQPYNPAANHCIHCGSKLRHYTTSPSSEIEKSITPSSEIEKSIPPSSKTQKPTPRKNNSKAWYLLPVFFSIIGGLIMYAALRNQNGKMAKYGLIIGFVMIIPGVLFIGILGSGDVDNNDRPNPNSNTQKDTTPKPVILDNWDYEDMLRNESFYENKIISIKGVVSNYIQYDESSRYGLGICHDQLKNDFSGCEQRFWVYHEGERVLEGDVVEVTGVFLQISELTNAIGVKSYHPSLDSQTLVLVESDTDE